MSVLLAASLVDVVAILPSPIQFPFLRFSPCVMLLMEGLDSFSVILTPFFLLLLVTGYETSGRKMKSHAVSFSERGKKLIMCEGDFSKHE